MACTHQFTQGDVTAMFIPEGEYEIWSVCLLHIFGLRLYTLITFVREAYCGDGICRLDFLFYEQELYIHNIKKLYIFSFVFPFFFTSNHYFSVYLLNHLILILIPFFLCNSYCYYILSSVILFYFLFFPFSSLPFSPHIYHFCFSLLQEEEKDR